MDILRTFFKDTLIASVAILIFAGIVAICVYGIERGGATGFAIVLLTSAIVIGAAATLAKCTP